VDVFLHAYPMPGEVRRLAVVAEGEGWDGLLLADSQNLQAEVFVELALAARATERLLLGTGVTNPITRHPAVIAGAAATLQAESNARMHLGIGRGDSSVALIGKRPAPLNEFEDFLRRLQAYLAGEIVEHDGLRSRLEWLPPSLPKVPVDVAATGPRTIAVAARHADAVTFAVGADPERLRWALSTARAAGARRFGAYIVAATDPDLALARDLVRVNVAIFANFARHSLAHVDRGTIREIVPPAPTVSAGSSAPEITRVPDDFIDRFAVVGPANHCAERLREIATLGIERVVIVGASKDVDASRADEARKRFADEVLPALRDF